MLSTFLQVGVEFDPLVSDTHQSLTKLQYPGRVDTSVLPKALQAVRAETQSTPGVKAPPATKRRRTDEVGDKAPSAKTYLKYPNPCWTILWKCLANYLP